MIHFHPLRVKDIRRETEDCVLISFDVPAELKEAFRFKQGQNITIRKELNGQELRRNYSICTSPLEDKLTVAVKKVDGGLFSTYANEELKKGDVLDVIPPTGSFYTELHPSQQKTYVAFAAGSGITPIISIIKATLQTEPKSNFTLVYGNRNRGSIIFKEELEALKDKYIDRFRFYHILSREQTDSPINSGRLDKDKCEYLFDKLIDIKTIDDFFICGPEQMIFCIKDLLEEKGVNQEHIHFELFTVPGENKSENEKPQVLESKGEKALVSVRLDGITFSFELGYHENSILDAALDEGADLPYACKGGVCTTCKAKLTKGQVVMDTNWGLAEEEVEKGFVLTCQSHPTTPTVFIDFDAR